MFPLILLAYVVAVKVFKKSAPNGKLTVYLGKRDFGDYGDTVEPVEGVVLVDNDYLKDRKVFGQVVTTFRYGREEDEVMGLHFSRQLYLALEQVFPTSGEPNKSELQDKLIKKLGEGKAIPFSFDLPDNAPPSVTLQPGSDDQGAPLGVEYELKLFVAESKEEKPHRRNSVSMAIRKLQFFNPGPNIRQPSSLVSKGFVLSPGKLQLEVTLDKEYYFHGDKVQAHVVVTNHSKKTIRNIKVSVVQNTEVTMVNGHYNKAVASIDSKEGCPIIPGATLSKVYYLVPTAEGNKSRRRGIAMDGLLKEGDTNLASSTLNAGDNLGIIISYLIRVKLHMGAIGGDLVADVPFKLTSPPPDKAREVREKQKEFRKLTREISTDLVFEDFARRDSQDE